MIIVCAISLPAAAGTLLPDNPLAQKQYFEHQNANGKTLKTAEGSFLTCKSSLLIGGFYETDSKRISLLHDAIDACITALTQQPGYYEAQISLAIALSYEGKRLSKAAYPKKAKALLEDLIDKYPNSPNAYGALAAWHNNVSNAGFLARIALGASRKKASYLFENAEKLGVSDFGLRLEHIKFLASSKQDQKKQSLVLLDALLKSTPKSETDELFLIRAQKLKDALMSKDKGRLENTLAEISAFSGIKDQKDLPAFDLDRLGILETNN